MHGDSATLHERELLAAARDGDATAYERLVEPYRRQLHAHCYRMLGSIHDADDALQDALLGAWRGLGGFEGRSSLRTWLYRIATNACLRTIDRRPARMLSIELGPSGGSPQELGERLDDGRFLEPYPDLGMDAGPAAPDARYEQRESVELAFVAALQHLPATQRAVLILRDVLGFSAREAADALDTTVASVNSALQRARVTAEQRLPPRSQQTTLRALGNTRLQRLVTAYVDAWNRGDVDAIVALLAEDAVFTMPPNRVWFEGRDEIRRALAERIMQWPWRLLPTTASGQLAVACYTPAEHGDRYRLWGVNVLTVRGAQIAEIVAFLSPQVYERFELPAEAPHVDR